MSILSLLAIVVIVELEYRIMEQHSREVTEMEQILQEQIQLAQEDTMQKVQGVFIE